MTIMDRHLFPAMLPRETAIWKSFLAHYGDGFTNFQYNVRVGQGFDPGPTFPDFSRQAAIKNSQLRLDVVAQKDNAWWIIEVKVHCGAGAVGQLKQYEVLYEEAFPTNRPIQLAICTDLPKLGLKTLCDRLGIQLYILPTDLPQPVL